MIVERERITKRNDRGWGGMRPVSWPSAFVALAGLWLIVAPVLLDRTGSRNGIWSDLATGAAMLSIAVLRLVSPVRTALLGLANAALGVWLIIAPFALHFQGLSVPGRANDLVVGIAVVVLALLGTINCSFAWQPPRRPHRI